MLCGALTTYRVDYAERTVDRSSGRLSMASGASPHTADATAALADFEHGTARPDRRH